MSYKQVCENELQRFKDIITSLCSLRDSYKKGSAMEKFFQSQIEGIAILKNTFEQEFMNAQIDEQKKNL